MELIGKTPINRAFYQRMSDNYKLIKPIFIIGNIRSGTTILSDILGQHKDVAFWLEPKYIWRYGNASAKHDLRSKTEATESVKKYIRKRFYNHVQTNGKTRFIEKTPSNVFRVSFMHEIFPDGLFVRIIRNGRDSALSAERKWTSPPDKSAFKRRLTSNEIPISELPLYTFAAVRDVLGRTFMPKKGFVWGQQFEGIHEYRRDHSVIETCAMQWAEGTRISNKELEKIPEHQKYTLRYEDISADLESQVNGILDFAELEKDDKVIKYAQQKVFHTKDRKYTEEDRVKLEKIEPIIDKQMKALGYK